MTNSLNMVLTSDASVEQFSENKAAEFKIQVPNQMHLTEDWDVAMTRIVYPYTWVNVWDNELSFTLICEEGLAAWKLSIY